MILQVGDLIKICVRIGDFCSPLGNKYVINDVSISKQGLVCQGDTSSCLSLSGMSVRIGFYNALQTMNDCNTELIKVIQNVMTDNNGIAYISYVITEADYNNYLLSVQNNTYFDIGACVTNGNDSFFVKRGAVRGKFVTNDPLVIAPAGSNDWTDVLTLTIKPHRFYDASSAKTEITKKIADITGKLSGLFSSITGYEYKKVEFHSDGQFVYLDIFYKNLTPSRLIAQSIPIGTVVILVTAIIITIGFIVGVKFLSNLLGESYTSSEVNEILNETVQYQIEDYMVSKPGASTEEKVVAISSIICGKNKIAYRELLDDPDYETTCDKENIQSRVEACVSQNPNDITKQKECFKNIDTQITQKIDKSIKEKECTVFNSLGICIRNEELIIGAGLLLAGFAVVNLLKPPVQSTTKYLDEYLKIQKR